MIRHLWFMSIVCTLIGLGSLPVTQIAHAQTNPSESGIAPDITLETRRLAGMVLCQNALAENILVIGDNMGLVHTLLLSDAVQSVTWVPPSANPGNQPQPSLIRAPRLILHTGTVTSLLEAHAQTYDIILVNTPESRLSAYRDTLSPEFQTLIQQALTLTGLVAIRIPGSNTQTLSQHQIFLDATLYQQLNARFAQALVVPGEPLFFLCSNINYMTTYAPRLEARFSLLDQAESILPRYHLVDLYHAERSAQIKAQLETVDSAIPFSPGLYYLLYAADTLHVTLLPWLKTLQQAGLWCLGILIATAIITRLLYVTRNRPGTAIKPSTLLTPVGYGLFWIGLSLILMVHLIDYLNRPRMESTLMREVPEWTEGLKVTQKNLAASDTAPPVPYQEVWNNKQLTGYIFQTRDFTGTVYGYGGPMGLILFVEPDGTLIDFRFTQSYETPRYIYRIRGWLEALKGRTVFGNAPLQDVYTISGATLSTRAIMRLMHDSGQQFAAQVLAQNAIAKTPRSMSSLLIQHQGLLYLLTGLALALIAIFHGKLWSRILVLIYTTGVFGFWLNKQFSTDHIMRLLEWNHVFSGSPESLALLIGVPILLLLFGNLYCGTLCPFGALQELLGFLIPNRFKPTLSHSTVQGARFIKYGVLFALVISVFVLKNKESLQIDPLTSFFNTQLWPDLLLTPLWLFLGIGILFVTRFWCRVLCPTGAFLSLLNRCAWLQRFLPAKKYGRCEFGLTGRDHLDCIYCDRCRYENALIPARNQAITKDGPNLISRLFLIWALITASLLIWPLVHKDTPATEPNTPNAVVQTR